MELAFGHGARGSREYEPLGGPAVLLGVRPCAVSLPPSPPLPSPLKVSQFAGVEYSAAVADFMSWSTLRPEAAWHPRIRDVVYWGMDWLCPAYSNVLARQIDHYHGNLTAYNTIHDIVSIVQTGDLHVAVYDLGTMTMFVATARGDGEEGPAMAYDRSVCWGVRVGVTGRALSDCESPHLCRAFLRLDMKAIFAERPPLD